MKRNIGSLILSAGLALGLTLGRTAFPAEKPVSERKSAPGDSSFHRALRDEGYVDASLSLVSRFFEPRRPRNRIETPVSSATPLEGWRVITGNVGLPPRSIADEASGPLKRWGTVEEIFQTARHAALNRALRHRIPEKTDGHSRSTGRRRFLRWLRFRTPPPEPPAPPDTTFTETNARALHSRK